MSDWPVLYTVTLVKVSFVLWKKKTIVQNLFELFLATIIPTICQNLWSKLHSDTTVCNIFMSFWDVNGLMGLFKVFLPFATKSCSFWQILGC